MGCLRWWEKSLAKAIILGIEELVTQLNRLPPATAGKALRQAVGQAATPVVQEARLRVPVRTSPQRGMRTYKGNIKGPGFAKQSIAKRTKLANGVAIAYVGAKKEAFYATQFVEVGTQFQREQPWLVPALEAAQPKSIRTIQRALSRKILQAVRNGPKIK